MGMKKTYMKAKKKVFGDKGFRGRYDPTRAGVKSLTNLAKDIKMIQERLNVEKNFKDTDLATVFVAQVDGNGEGAYCTEVTPVLPQGDGKGQRVGNSLKMTGMSFPIQFCGQANTLSGRRLRFTLIRSRGKARTSAEVFTDLYDANPINGIARDFNAPRKYTKGDGLQVIRSQNYYLKPPALDGGSQGVTDTEFSQLTVKFNVKLQDTLRYDSDATTDPDNIRYFVLIQTDLGNKSGSTVSTLDIPVTSLASGVLCRFASRAWYCDN